jgi:4-hydroxybenzoate polyprenyltransferase
MTNARSVIKSYIDLCRVSNLPTVWTNVLAALVLSGTDFHGKHYLTLLLSLSLFYSAGMCLNDICDAVPDKTKKSFRPIPSGRVSLRKASLFTFILFAVGLGLLVLMPSAWSTGAGVVLLVLIVAYDILHKAHAWTVVLMAGCRFMIYVVVSTAITGSLVPVVMLAGFLQFLYIIVVSLIARYENRMPVSFSFPVIPVMLACVSVLDGIVMAFFAHPLWLLAGITGCVLTILGQRFVRGD